MKKLLWVLGFMLLLSGCGKMDLETVSDLYDPPETPVSAKIQLELPEDTAVEAISGTDCLYFCGGYTAASETLEAGDLEKTLMTVTGFPPEALSVIAQRQGEWNRYDFVWTCAGEGGDQLCRGALLDDGSYHYVVTVMAPEASAGNFPGNGTRFFAPLL